MMIRGALEALTLNYYFCPSKLRRLFLYFRETYVTKINSFRLFLQSVLNQETVKLLPQQEESSVILFYSYTVFCIFKIQLSNKNTYRCTVRACTVHFCCTCLKTRI
jgi:hypothetical protein